MSEFTQSDNPSLNIGVDIGGTFTDIIAFDFEGSWVHVTKVPSTPSQPADAVINGLESLFESSKYSPDDISTISHGSTVTINALLERDGAKTAILLTEGFDAIPVARRGDRPQADVKNPRYEPPQPLVPHRHVREVPERIDAAGTVREELDLETTREIVRSLRDKGIDSIAVCFLFSFTNSKHEERVESIIEEIHPECSVSLSSDISPRIREYPRLSTTTVNAYIDPILGQYLSELESRLQNHGVEPDDLSMMLSHGGLTSFSDASSSPASTPLSGPAAGVQGALFAARLSGIDDVVTLDMGGTSCDIAIAPDRDPLITTEKEIGGNPVTVPMVDIQAIGAGGGTIARVENGRLLVGPESAGADPGPICYGRGGDRVTITDANLVLGRLNPEALLGGDLSIKQEPAERAIRNQIAEPLNLSVTEAAAGVLEIVDNKMKKELSLSLTKEGEDPREFALVAYGGAGPMHAPSIARELSIDRVVVPRYPGINSAVGLLSTDRKRVYERSRVEPLQEADFNRMFDSLRDEAITDIDAGRDEISFREEIELRYAGQSYELAIPVRSEDSVDTLIERFNRIHEENFGHVSEQALETMTYRITATRETERLSGEILQKQLQRTNAPLSSDSRQVYFDGEYIPTEIYSRGGLKVGASFSGPAIVEQSDTTTVIDPKTRVEVDDYGNLVLTFEGDGHDD